MPAGAGIAAIVTAPIGVLFLLVGLITAVVIVARTRQARSKLLAFAGSVFLSVFLAFALDLVTLGVASALLGEAGFAVLFLPVIGLNAGIGLTVGALIATGRLGPKNRPQKNGNVEIHNV